MKRQYKWVKKKFKELKILLGNKCIYCGIDKELEFAHVRKTELSGRSRGTYKRYYDIKNNIDCYRLMCEGCHKKRDEWKKMINEPEYYGNPF
jgi:hypothetical protein